MSSIVASIRSKAVLAAVLSLLLAVSAVMPFARVATAQEATPEAPVSAVPADLPVITITVNEFAYSINLPVPVLPGQYVISVVNTTDALAVANVVGLPEEVAFGDLTSVLFSSFQGEGGDLPDWWSDANFAGGSWAGAQATSETVVNLEAGQYTVFSGNPASVQSPQNFTVSTEEEAIAAGYIAPPEESATPVASPVAEPAIEFPVLDSVGQIEIADDSVTATGGASGPGLWQVTNNGEQPHDLVVYQVADGTDAAGAAALAATVAAGEAPADATLFASIGLLSPGSTGYIAGYLEPGTYAVFSTAPDVNGGLQADAGVAAVIVVE
jgi:hypothetical protein